MFGLKRKYLDIARVILIVSLGMFVALSNGAFAGTDDSAAAVLNKVAQKEGVNVKDIEITDSATIQLPHTGKVATVYKAKAKGSDAAYSVTLDETGKEVDLETLLAAESAAKTAKNGKKSDELAEQLKQASKDVDSIDVIIVLNEPDYVADRPVLENNAPSMESESEENPETATDLVKDEDSMEKANENRAAAVRKVTGPVLAQMKKMGYIGQASSSAPMIAAKLTPKGIEALEKLTDVKEIHLAPVNKQMQDIARKALKAEVPYNAGIAGFGTKVGEIEVGGGINSLNPYLAPPIELDTTNTCVSFHAAAVAGIIRSWHPTYLGDAPGAWLRIGGSCGGWFSELQAAEDRAASWGAWVLTNSWGSTNPNGLLTVMDNYMDGMVRNSARTVVVSAGNEGGYSNNVTSPALAFNIVTVGAYDDRNTVSWLDDVMASYSSWENPRYPWREKPDVVAPGSNIISTTNSYPWYGNQGSGTSYSAPGVAAVAAQMLQRNTGLKGWPEPTKAILLATAKHDIITVNRTKDGAGGVAADRADKVARRVNGSWGGMGYSCATPRTNISMALTAGVPTRAVVVYDANTTYSGYYNGFPGADIDFSIYNPAGAIVTGSYGIDTVEYVDYVPPTSGTYKLSIYRFSCSASPGYLGWAWYKGT